LRITQVAYEIKHGVMASLAATMSQKSSVPQATKFVSQALKQDNARL
jgi:hypothetical protein